MAVTSLNLNPMSQFSLATFLFSATKRETWLDVCPCNAPINVMSAGGGDRAWGGDLIVFVVPGVGHLTDLVLPGEGIFESFFARRGDI